MVAVIRLRHQHIDVFANHFKSVIAENYFCRVIKSFNDSVLVDSNNGVNRRVQDCAQPAFSFSNRRRIQLLIADVACDFRGGNDFSLRVINRRYGCGNIDQSPVLALAYRCKVFNPFTA